MTSPTEIELRWTTGLTSEDHAAMAALFDAVYLDGWGPWDPRRGYGYARGELHALARSAGRLVGYATSARRFVGVGDREVVIAGTGGVVTSPESRRRGVGRAVVRALQEANRGLAPAQFGFLGCREEVVPFYESCGFRRIGALVRDVSPRDATSVVESRGPTMICAGTEPLDAWPDGPIDLRELPW